MASLPSTARGGDAPAAEERSKRAYDIAADTLLGHKKRIRETFRDNLGRILTERRMKQSELAELLNAHLEEAGVLADPDDPAKGVKRVQAWELSRWARAQITPDPTMITAIATVLEVKPEDLVEGINRDRDPQAMVFSAEELSDGGVYVRFQGRMPRETWKRLLPLLADD